MSVMYCQDMKTKNIRQEKTREGSIKEIKKGFTLIEVLVVIGILAILATVVLVAVNPARQFKIARDSQRTANVTAILNAIGQNMTDNRGLFSCKQTRDIKTGYFSIVFGCDLFYYCSFSVFS